MNTLTVAAERWNNDGIAVIPIAYRGKRPTIPTWREFQNRLPTNDEMRRWFRDKFNNLAIVTGWRGLVVIDFDQRAAYNLWRDWSRDSAPGVRFSYTVETARGVHVYLFIDEPTPTMRAGNIDIKAAGGYVLAPPSIHPSGKPYRVLSDGPILRYGKLAAVLPSGLLALAQPVTPVRPERPVPSTDPWQSAMTPIVLHDGDGPIAAIKARHSTLDLFPDAKRRGRGWVARCPLHDDRHPSVSISEDGQYAKCWGGCAQGDYIDWYAAMNGITVHAAIQMLA